VKATVRCAAEMIASSDVKVLWRVGGFTCELRVVADEAFAAMLCMFKDGDPVLELPVLSALEAEERAHGLRILVERHQPEYAHTGCFLE